jgi:glycosyltransferase involved in cell wall biosynthesis
MARVAIIIPAFNAGRFLAETLQSVKAQRIADWTCVIVDDGSSDDTVQIARKFAEHDERFQVAVQPQNGGVSRARMEGLATLPQTPYLIFLDADDVWLPLTLERLLKELEASPQTPAVHGLASFIDAAGEPNMDPALNDRLRRQVLRDGTVVDAAPVEPTTSQMLATWPCVITPGVVLIRRTAWDASGGWDANLSIGEDWELWYRLALKHPLAFVNEPLIRFRVYGSSSSSNWKRPIRLAKARAKVFSSGSREDQRYARRAFRAMSRKLGVARVKGGLASLARLELKPALKGLVGGAINLGMSLKP